MLGGGQTPDEAPARRSAPSSGGLNDILGDLLGGGNSGNRSAADDLLNSVQQAIRNR